MTKKFLIVCQARTGSTALITSLMQHSQIAAHGEIFGGKNNPIMNVFGINNKLNPPIVEYLRNIRDTDPINFFDNILMRDSAYKATGFKFKYEELKLPQWLALQNHVTNSYKDISIVFLTRPNLLDRELSEYIALNVTKMYNTRDKSYKQAPVSVTLDPKELEKKFDRSLRWQEKFFRLFSKHDSIHITYDELTTSNEDTLRRVQAFLGTDIQNITPLTQKLQRQTTEESILNYDEIRHYFKDSKYKSFFNLL